jgi:bifunctional non-homologous end joining protein LigD
VLTLPAPMLATAGRPRGSLDDWTVEAKIDGWRVLVGVDRSGTAHVQTRRGRTLAAVIPEVTALRDLGVELILDGELIVGDGRPADFYRLAGALSARSPAAGSAPCFVAFDLLRLDGTNLMDRPQYERRHLLQHVAGILGAHALPIVPSYPGVDVDHVLSSCESHQLEGVVLKQRNATYRPGTRSADWRKIKCAAWAEHRTRRFPLSSTV